MKGGRRVAGPSPTPKDAFFDPWRAAGSPHLRTIVQEAVADVERLEATQGLRKRKRRPADQTVFEYAVEALVCDAAFHFLQKPGRKVALSLSNKDLGTRDRYGSPVHSKALPAILTRLAELGWLRFEKGAQQLFDAPGRRSTFEAGPRLLELIAARDMILPDIGQRPGEELLVLKRGKEGFWDKGGRVDYLDTDETQRMRAEVAEINEWLAAADLWVDEGAVDVSKVPLGERRLQRVFNNGRFGHSGRLFGGFWMDNKIARSAIRFGMGDGIYEEGVEIDFAQTSVRILYGMAGVEPPPGDLYAVPGMEHGRDVVKGVVNALFFGGAERKRYPKGVRAKRPLRWDIKAPEVIEKFFVHHHPCIRELLYEPDIGFRVWAVESRILVSALLRLKAEGIVAALPVHDAVVVPALDKERALHYMDNTFMQALGIEGGVRSIL